MVEKVYDFGKTGNVFKRVIEVRKLEKEGMDFPLTFSVDKAETRKVVKKKAKKFLAKKRMPLLQERRKVCYHKAGRWCRYRL